MCISQYGDSQNNKRDEEGSLSKGRDRRMILSDEIRKKQSIQKMKEQYEYYKNVPERGLTMKGRPALTQIEPEKVGDFVPFVIHFVHMLMIRQK